jgi:hypothetical protein
MVAGIARRRNVNVLFTQPGWCVGAPPNEDHRGAPGQTGSVTQVGSSRASVASGNEPCPSTWS